MLTRPSPGELSRPTALAMTRPGDPRNFASKSYREFTFISNSLQRIDDELTSRAVPFADSPGGVRVETVIDCQVTKKSVFISYSTADRPRVDGLERLLVLFGHEVFLDYKQLRLGSRWKDEIASALIEPMSRWFTGPDRPRPRIGSGKSTNTSWPGRDGRSSRSSATRLPCPSR